MARNDAPWPECTSATNKQTSTLAQTTPLKSPQFNRGLFLLLAPCAKMGGRFSNPSATVLMAFFASRLRVLRFAPGTVFSLTAGNDMMLAAGSNMTDPVVRFGFTSRRLILSGFQASVFIDTTDRADGDPMSGERRVSLNTVDGALLGDGGLRTSASSTSCAMVRGRSVGY